ERYFATRATFVSVSMLCAFLWAGYHLRDAAAADRLSGAFALLFSIGFVARLGSVAALIRQADPSPVVRDSLRRVLARTRSAVRGDSFKLAVLLGIWLFGAQVSIPFYAPYMLKTLSLGYDEFALLCAVLLVTKTIAFALTHRVTARFGLERILVGSIGLAAV